MSTATLSRNTMTPMLPFDFDSFSAAHSARAEDDTKNADRELCQQFLANWANNFAKTGPRQTSAISFAEFTLAAARLSKNV